MYIVITIILSMSVMWTALNFFFSSVSLFCCDSVCLEFASDEFLRGDIGWELESWGEAHKQLQADTLLVSSDSRVLRAAQ